jgi:hypothetical protein
LQTVFSDEFTNYKVVFNQTASNGATATFFQYINNSNVVKNDMSYHRKILASETATVTPPPSSGALTDRCPIFNAPASRIGYSEITFFGPRSTVHPRTLSNSVSGNLSTSSRVEQIMSFYNTIPFKDIMKGLYIFSNGTQRITGTIQVYGYR